MKCRTFVISMILSVALILAILLPFILGSISIESGLPPARETTEANRPSTTAFYLIFQPLGGFKSRPAQSQP